MLSRRVDARLNFARVDFKVADNRGKIDSIEATIFTSRVAVLLYLHLTFTVFQLTKTVQVTIVLQSLGALNSHSATAA